VTVSEPATLLTDYALGAVSLWISIKLFQKKRWWSLCFAALAAAAFLGGTWHGFVQSDALWKATLIAAGVASFGMTVGAGNETDFGKLFFAFGLVKLLLYAFWMLSHDEFIWVVADSGSALAVVAAVYLWRLNGWMLAGVALAVAGALVQAGGLALHPHFNHNDLYHVMQTVAILLMYRGLARKGS
jgi:hypothetical protein